MTKRIYVVTQMTELYGLVGNCPLFINVNTFLNSNQFQISSPDQEPPVLKLDVNYECLNCELKFFEKEHLQQRKDAYTKCLLCNSVLKEIDGTLNDVHLIFDERNLSFSCNVCEAEFGRRGSAAGSAYEII